MKILTLNNFASFDELYKQYVGRNATNDLSSLILLFEASDIPEAKESCTPWCSDCRDSKPVIESVVEKFKYNDMLTLATVKVGLKEEWKKSENPFRKHELKIEAVPTLYSLKTGLRLVEADCADAAKVSHLFSNSL